MKALLALMFVFSAPSIAVEIDALEMARLPVLQNVKLVSVSGPRFAAVQPTGWIEFSFASCAQWNFDADINEQYDILFIAIKPGNGRECHGPAQVRNYKVQYSSDTWANEKVVILNPQTLTSPNPLVR